MTRQKSYQQGYVSEPIHTRRGIAFKIRYRVQSTEGKWKQRSETLYDQRGKKAARAVLEQRIRDASATPPESSNLTFREFVEACWIPYLERKGMKPSTKVGYECALQRHILPALGDLNLINVSPMHIENFVRAKMDTKSGLHPKTVLNLLRLIQGIFSVAVDNDLIARSPVRDKHKPVVPKSEKPAWTPEQVRTILDEIPSRYRPVFICVALTGLRAGELLGLKWKHVGLENGELRVEQSLWNKQIVAPKTRSSRDSVWFDAKLTQVLAQHRENSLHTAPDDFVFCGPDGAPLNPDVLRRDVLYPALDRLRIPRVKGASGFHAFRHTAGSVVEARTGRLKLAQRLLRHSNISTTADIYTHVTKQGEREAAIALEGAYFGDLFPVVPNLGNGNKNEAVN
jgi:integrase